MMVGVLDVVVGEDALYVLVRRFVDRDQVEVVRAKPAQAEQHEHAVREENDRDDDVHVPEIELIKLVLAGEKKHCERRQRRVEQRHGGEEEDKGAVVPPTDAVADPRAVVVEAVDAVVACRAVLAPRRLLQVARGAVPWTNFWRNLPIGLSVKLGVVKVRRLRLRIDMPLPPLDAALPEVPWQDARVGEGRCPEQCLGQQHEERDHARVHQAVRRLDAHEAQRFGVRHAIAVRKRP
mmetsp:Transcript_20033/g.52424  ORF Transcript_20033/g.52424 Transcript_20033/m.52424 type:complete len:236 (+) Transcript_20033:340-1047(+)